MSSALLAFIGSLLGLAGISGMTNFDADEYVRIDPDMVPTTGTKPLPLIHDLYAFAYLPVERLTDQARAQLDDIATYVTDERYRSFPPGYGYIWPEANRRTCYACGWNLDLPDLDSPNPCDQRKIVQRMELRREDYGPPAP